VTDPSEDFAAMPVICGPALTAVNTVQIVVTGAITGTVFVTLPVNCGHNRRCTGPVHVRLSYRQRVAIVRVIDITAKPIGKPGSLLVVPTRSALEVDLSERPNDELAVNPPFPRHGSKSRSMRRSRPGPISSPALTGPSLHNGAFVEGP
jgi:hypothetical protein